MSFPSEAELKAIEDRSRTRKLLDDYYRATTQGDGPSIEIRTEVSRLLQKQQDAGFRHITADQDIKTLLGVIRDLYSLHKSAGMVKVNKD